MPSVSWISPPTPRGWLRDLVEHAGRQHVAAGDAQARRRASRARASRRSGSTSIRRSLDRRARRRCRSAACARRHFLHGEDRGAPAANCSTICVSTGGAADHQVVGQQDGERLVADQAARAQHGVAQAERLRLAHVEHSMSSGLTLTHHARAARACPLASRLASSSKVMSKWSSMARLWRPVTKIMSPDAGGVGLLDGVLDQGLVDDRQHLLGLRLGGGEKAGAEAGHRERSALLTNMFLTIRVSVA